MGLPPKPLQPQDHPGHHLKTLLRRLTHGQMLLLRRPLRTHQRRELRCLHGTGCETMELRQDLPCQPRRPFLSGCGCPGRKTGQLLQGDQSRRKRTVQKWGDRDLPTRSALLSLRLRIALPQHWPIQGPVLTMTVMMICVVSNYSKIIYWR